MVNITRASQYVLPGPLRSSLIPENNSDLNSTMSLLDSSAVVKFCCLKPQVCCVFTGIVMRLFCHTRCLPPYASGVNVRMRLLSFVLLLLLSAASAGADSKAITTTLTTKWADTPLLLEARYPTAQL